MIKLMEHIEYFYEPIPTLDGQTKYYVYLKDEEWQMIEDGHILVKTKRPRLILDMLKDFGADLEIFNMLLQGSVAVEAVNHIHALKLCEELVGKDLINQTMQGVEDMCKKVKKVLDRTRLKVVK